MIAVGLGAAAIGSLLIYYLTPAATDGDRRLIRLASALLSKLQRPSHSSLKVLPPPELLEKGHNGTCSNRRMFFQLRVLEAKDAKHAQEAIGRLKEAITGVMDGWVIYSDACSSRSLGLLVWTEKPEVLAIDLPQVISSAGALVERPGWTMLGRTYSNGHERDLEDFLLKKPVRTVISGDEPWAVWYPMRRKGLFYLQPGADQCEMLLHHAAIGKSYGDAGAAKDVRLKCYGIDEKDNEFLIGLVGKELFALSRIVEDLRKTHHTSTYMKSLGPFFVGLRVHSSATS